ncbi:MAG TPA: FkbM family methyltransferase [Dongiaceae bacterium]
MGQAGTQKVDITWGDRVFPFHCFDNQLSIRIARDIFAGETYRPSPHLRDVRLIVDIGANIGAASVFLHTRYPAARIVAIEPSPAAFALLCRNAAAFPQIEPRQTALYDKKASLHLHTGRVDSVTNSFGVSVLTKEKGGETLELEDAAGFFLRERLQNADIVKLDTEGCEWPILTSLRPWLGQFRAIYLEYHSETDRRRIDRLLEPTHLLESGVAHDPHRGEFCYIARSTLPANSAHARMEIRPPQI